MDYDSPSIAEEYLYTCYGNIAAIERVQYQLDRLHDLFQQFLHVSYEYSITVVDLSFNTCTVSVPLRTLLRLCSVIFRRPAARQSRNGSERP